MFEKRLLTSAKGLQKCVLWFTMHVVDLKMFAGYAFVSGSSSENNCET